MNSIKNKIKLLKSCDFRNNILNRLFVIAIFTFGGIVVLLSLDWLFLNSFGRFNNNGNKDHALIIESPKLLNVSPHFLVNNERCLSCASVTLEFQNFSIIERKLKGNIQIFVPKSELIKLWGDYEYVFIQDTEDSDKLILKEKFKYLKVSLMAFSKYDSDSEFEIKIPLRKLLESSDKKQYQIDFSLDLFGDSRSYPSDWYHNAYEFSLSLPNGISSFNSTGLNSYIPIQMLISSSFALGDFNLLISPVNSNGVHFFPLEISLERDTLAKRYIYAMAFLPILFSLIFFHSNYSRKKKRRGSSGNTIIELSIMMFSVLPLRSVLVPSTFESLVRIDLILGLGIAFMIFFAVIIYSKEIW